MFGHAHETKTAADMKCPALLPYLATAPLEGFGGWREKNSALAKRRQADILKRRVNWQFRMAEYSSGNQSMYNLKSVKKMRS